MSPNYTPYFIIISCLESHDCVKWWIKLLCTSLQREPEGPAVLRLWRFTVVSQQQHAGFKESRGPWPIDLAGFIQWAYQPKNLGNRPHNLSWQQPKYTYFMNGKHWRPNTAEKYDLVAIIAEQFLLDYAWSKQTKNSCCCDSISTQHHLSDKKHLQALNSIHRADRQNYLEEDEACNDHHYPNKAIILSWHVSYAAKAMLPGLEVANHSALQPDRSSLFTTYAILVHHTWNNCQHWQFPANLLKLQKGSQADSSCVRVVMKRLLILLFFCDANVAFNNVQLVCGESPSSRMHYWALVLWFYIIIWSNFVALRLKKNILKVYSLIS